MLERQRGTLNLYWVAIVSAGVAAVAMAAIYSMRYERNLFAEGWAKVAGAAPAQQALDAGRRALATSAPGSPSGAMRKCVIDGMPVVSNTDCVDSNPTSKAIKIIQTRGIEAPKQPVVADPAPGSDPRTDKLIEKQLR